MSKITNIFFLFCLSFSILPAAYVPRLKEISHLSNVKNNVFTGYGIVVGLSGTGDKKNPLTQKSLENFLKKQDLKIEKNKFNTRNSAMVSVVAKTFGFLWKGDTVDISVASLGDAKKIDNGFLLPTTLKAGNGEKYILASGSIKTTAATPTLGIISSGGIIEKNLSQEDNSASATQTLSTNLSFIVNENNSNYLTAIKKKIEETFPATKVTLQDSKRFFITKKNQESFRQDEIMKILNVKINIPPKAKIIIDKKTGIVVIGGDIKINPTHISFPYTSIDINSARRKGNKYASINDLVQELNALNISTEEIISIFTGLKRSGAINAELIFQ